MDNRKIYLLQYDNQHFYVEARSMALAIEAWKKHVAVEWGKDCDGTEEPESCALVETSAFIRGAD